MTRRQLYLLAGIMTVFQPPLFQDKVAPTANAMDELRVEGASQQPDASNEFDRAIVLADLAHQAEREGLLHLALRYRSERVRVLQEQYSDDHWHVIKARNEKKDGAALVRLWEDQDTRMRVMELVRLEGDVLRLGAQQRMPEVLPKALRLLDLTDELLGNVSHRYLINAKRVALVYRYIDRLDKAIPRWRDSLAIAEQLYGNAHPMYAITLSGWADTLVKSGDFDDAIDKFVSALDILRQVRPAFVEAACGPSMAGGLLRG